jgi:hypothetical protein
VRQEDVVHHEAGVVAEALEVIVVAEALGAAEAQEGSAVVVAVGEDSEDLGEVVVVSEGHDIVFMYVKKMVDFKTSKGRKEQPKSQSRMVDLHGLGSHGKVIPSKDRIVTERSFYPKVWQRR